MGQAGQGPQEPCPLHLLNPLPESPFPPSVWFQPFKPPATDLQ